MHTSDEKIDRLIEALHQLNVHFEGLKLSLASLVEQGVDHERRIRSMEKWQQNLTPVLAVMTFVLGSVFTVALQRFFA